MSSSVHARVLPVVVSIDCEPDPRVTPRAGPPPWDGMDGTIRLVERWRTTVPDARVGWYWRVDPQVHRGHGDAGWPLIAFRDHIERTLALGDEHGVHPHPWRWNEEAGEWVSDAADQDWMETCIETSIESFTRVLERPVRAVRMGDGHMSPRIMARLAKAGVLCDLTLEPGAPAAPSLVPSERSTGRIPDRTATPRRPYRPARLDPCRAGRCWWPHRLWALPLTTAPTGACAVAPGTVANLGFDPARFQCIVNAGLAASAAAGSAYIAVVARSDIGANPGLAHHASANLAWLAGARLQEWDLRFVGPMDALGLLGADAAGGP